MGTAVHLLRTCVSLRAGLLLAPLLLALSPGVARAIRCTKPDDLCTGDPCVIRQVEVASPCVLDFGDRELVVGGTISVPNGGTLTLKARDIDVRRAIIGRHATPFAGLGGTVTLVATDDVAVRWRIDVSGRIAPGRIVIQAGGDVELLAPLRAASNGPNPTASGGDISVTAGGRLSASGRARLRAEGASGTAGGSIALTAGTGMRLDNRIGADGRDGGSVALTALSGDLVAYRTLSAAGLLGSGGSVVAFARTGSVLLLDNADAEGVNAGGTVFAIAARLVSAAGLLRARANPALGTGGSVVVMGGTNIRLQDTVSADGAVGGLVQVVSSDGGLQLVQPLLADGAVGAGGRVIVSAALDTTVDATVDVDGRTRGGSIAISGRAVTLGDRGALFARGATGGTVTVEGTDVGVDAGARVLVDGTQPSGRIVLDARAGDLTLSGHFRARGHGGTIEGSAARGVHADGAFETEGGGCIGLMAGTTLDVSGASFDVPLMTACP